MRGVGARWLLAGAVWLAAVGGGFGVLFRYASARGADSRAPVEWPASTRLPRAADRATLVMFVHPRCACSRASLTELHKLVGRVRGQVTPEVVFIIPRGVEAGWDRTDLRSLAEHVPEVRIFDDPGGDEAHRFGAATSGATLLYDATGRLRFNGGITQVRGHEGDSFGQERIVALLRTGHADRAESPVFGCALDDHETSGR